MPGQCGYLRLCLWFSMQCIGSHSGMWALNYSHYHRQNLRIYVSPVGTLGLGNYIFKLDCSMMDKQYALMSLRFTKKNNLNLQTYLILSPQLMFIEMMIVTFYKPKILPDLQERLCYIASNLFCLV